jgi:hypothetical protein
MIYFVVLLLIVALCFFFRYSSAIKKNVFRRPVVWLDGVWYIFIIVFLGQLGPIIGYLSAFWFGKSVLGAIEESAGRAELISCATAILAGGTFFLVKEYNSSQEIKERKAKSVLILISAILGLACIGITAQLLAQNGLSSTSQKITHWIFYVGALVMAFVLWVFEEWQGTAAGALKEIEHDAKDLTVKSKHLSEVDGMKV